MSLVHDPEGRYGLCPECGAILRVRKDGTLRKHTNGIYDYCDGEGQTPHIRTNHGPVRNGRFDR